MKRMIENMTGNYSASASVVDGTLILSLPDAVTPVVWRLDLGHAKASALEVRDHEDGKFTLLLKTPRGDVNDIAHFASRGRAVAALMEVTRAMQNAHTQMNGQYATPPYTGEPYNAAHLPVPVGRKKNRAAPADRHHGGKGWIGGLVAIALIVLLGGVLMNMPPRHISPATTAASPGVNATQAAGVPVSADAFLKNR